MGKRKYSDNERESKKKKAKQDENTDNKADSSQEEQPQNESVPNLESEPKQNLMDLKHFRKELANKQGQTMALTQFLQVCLNPDSDVDYMLEYLRSGGNSHEILRQISQENKKNLTLATPTFHLFHLIILKVQSSLPHMITITEEACRYFLNTFVPTVEIMISENSGPRHRKIILNLLTSIVTLNSDLGIEVLNQIPLTPKNLQYIVERANYKEKDNVRTAFVHFITSFLVDGHLPLIKALLEKQGLLSLVIPGLTQDEPNAVLMFLNILKKNVIDNLLISKTLKLKTFSQQVLHNLFKVYQWRGPPEISNELRNESHKEIMALLSNIIITLFTSHKYGLYFVDNTLGTSDANKNQNLYKCLLTLKRPWENTTQCETILDIISKCPDLHRAIINVVEQSFQPQHTPIWEKATQFTIQLLDKMKPEDMSPRLKKLTPLQTVNFIRFVTLPVPLLKIIQINVGIDKTISLYCIKVLVKMLQTLKRYIQILEMDDSNVNIAELKQKLENFLPKHIPPPTSIVSLINNVLSGVSVTENAQDYSLPKLNDTDALLSLIDVLLLYNYTHLAFFESLESSIDMKKILEFSSNLTIGHISLLKFKIVSLWLMLDSSVLTLQNPMFKDLFLIMLEVYTSENDDTWIEAKETLQIFFKNTEIFENDEDEIHLMLYTLRNAKVSPTSLLTDVIEYVMKNGKELTEYIREQVSNFEISDEQNKCDLDTLLNDLMNNKNTENSVFLGSKISSPFIVGCVQYIQSNKESKKHLKQFLCLYITNLLHCNYSPELTEILIGDSKLDVRSYVASWLIDPVPLSETACNDVTLVKISKSIIGDEDLSLTDIFHLVQSTENIDSLVEVAYTLDMGKSVDSSELFIWAKYIMFCVVRLTNMEKIEENHIKKCLLYFDVIISIFRKHHMISECRNLILNLLKNAQLLKIYNPVDLNKNHNIIATMFILKVIEKYGDIVTYLNKKHHLLKPYQQKNYNELLKMFVKIKKKKNMNSRHTISVMETIGLSKENDFQLLEQIYAAETDTITYIKDDKEPSIIIDLLCVLLDKYSKIAAEFTQEVKKTMSLYTNLLTYKEFTPNLTKLESAMISFFEHKPHLVVHVKEDDYRQFFQANTIRKTTSQLASVLMKFNKKYVAVFAEQIKRPEILSQRELTLPIGNVAINHPEFITEHKDILNQIYIEYKSNIVKFLERPHKAGQVYLNSWQIIRKIVIECMDVQECQKLFSKNHKFEVIEPSHLQVLHAAYIKLCLANDTLRNDHLVNYALAMMQMCSNALKENKDDNLISTLASNIETILKVSKTVIQNLKEDSKKITDSSIWHGFCKSVLKESLRVKTADQANITGPKMLSLISSLIKAFYSNDDEKIVILFDMVTSHSEFLNVMLSHHSPEVKHRLLELLYLLATVNKSVMKSQQIPVYLSAYRATRSPTDRLILTILQFYESNNLPVNEYKPYVFGDSAANFYAVRKNKISTLWGHPSPNQVINLFDKEVIEKTVRHFPVNQSLDYRLDNEKISITSFLNKLRHVKPKAKDVETAIDNLIGREEHLSILSAVKNTDVLSSSHAEEHVGIYDPAFLYPLLSHLLAPGSVASCFKLLRSGLLSVAVMGLSSHCSLMRAAAYHVLHRFCMLLETETRHKNDKLLLNDFITTLRQSLSTAIDAPSDKFPNIKNPQLPAIGALYLAKALMVSTSPSEPLYKPVNNFLIAKQFVDLAVVPDFLSLFHDSEVEAVERRIWTLDIIKNGTKTMADVNVIFKTMCLKMIMDFYSTVLCDRRTKVQILSTLNSIITIPRAFEILVEGYGLLSWLHYVVRDLEKDNAIVTQLLDLLKNMIYSLNLNTFVKQSSKVEIEKVDCLSDFKIKNDLEYEILTVICNVLPALDVEEEFLDYVKLLNIITKRSIKFLNKKQVLNIIVKCCPKDDESAKLLEQSVVCKSNLVLFSKSLSTSESCLVKELRTFVYTYVA